MKILFYIICSLFWFFLPALTINAQDLYNKDNSRKFATFLYQSRQYDLAAREYERLYLISEERDPDIKLFKSYRLAGNYEMGISRVNNIYPNPSLYPSSVFFETSRMLLASGKFEFHASVVSQQEFLSPTDKSLLLGVQSVYANHRKINYGSDATEELQFYNPSMVQVHHILMEYKNEKWKSPALAASLSALIPGLGRWYAGDWKNAIASAVFVGINSYQSIRGFRNTGISSAQGWIFGAIGLGFYVGNIYGAAWTANRKNNQKKDAYKKRIEQYYFSF